MPTTPKQILHVVTNTAHYDDPSHPTGLWLSELTHAWHVFEEHGFEQTITAKAWKADPARMSLLENTARPDQLNSADFDAIYFTGGHGVMYDFLDDQGLQQITREIFERGGIVSSVCHGYCGLLNTRLSDGSYLVAGRNMTGFTWREEVLARVNKLVPYNAEEEVKKRGAKYKKAVLPFVSYTVVDANLVTGQNPGSAKETAEKVVAALSQQ
ncbi:intracellular protease/amidase [Penicillium cataractarum]|uniref:D-lactate dehydratase n=1 Tax=Penicillium cataractarum TaxID=2100454 RepID=A0A9W9VID7_9EURO|nr:intracellular protease/amidase [Penicillium cataractarum]KAJ5380545.1 intracellular protease/amidase [Penicillium cataractarum]